MNDILVSDRPDPAALPAPPPAGRLALPAGWRLSAARYGLLAVIAVALLWPGIARIPPLDRDEARTAQASAQMLESGDFVDIRFQDAPRYLHPAGVYWLQAAAVAVLSSSEQREIWANRVPGALAAVVSVLLTCRIGSVLYGATAGFVAGLLLAMSVLLGAGARMATVDAPALAAVLAAQAALLDAWRRRDTQRAGLAPWIFWIASGVGVLLKGPLILLVPGGTLAGLAVLERRYRWMRALRPVLGTGLMLAIVAPWLAGIDEASRGTFIPAWFSENVSGSVAAGPLAFAAPPGTYALLFLLMFWPGSLFAVRALPWTWSTRRTPEMRFLLAWILPLWVALELAAIKAPFAVLPALPPIAILAGAAMCAAEGWRLGQAVPRPFERLIVWSYGTLWVAAGLALALAGPVLLVWLEGRLTASALFAAVVATLLVVQTRRQTRRLAPRLALTCAAGAALAISLSATLVVLPALEAIWLSPRIAAALRALPPCPGRVLASVSYTEPSLVYLAGRDTKLVDPAGAAAFLLESPACGVVLVDARDVPAFEAQATALGVALRSLSQIGGIDYVTRRRLDLGFYTATAPKPREPASR